MICVSITPGPSCWRGGYDESATKDARAASYANTSVRQIVLIMDTERYARVLGLVRDLMDRDGAETSVDVVEAALRHHLEAGPHA